MAIKTITQRWILNSLSVIMIAILFIAVGFSFAVNSFYYTSVQQTVTAKANNLSNILMRLSDADRESYNAELRNMVINAEDKNKIQVSAIDHTGQVVLSSSGFSYHTGEEMPDYEDAQVSLSGMGYYVGKNAEGEKIMAVTSMIPSIHSDYAAIRYVVSLRSVDRMQAVYMIVVVVVSLLIIGFATLSGSYFIKSIVIPVREVSTAARNFAEGDMSIRIVRKSNDELGELCDIINYMADEMTNAEKVKNEFISSVSHELRTPLTAIKGWSETMATLPEGDVSTRQKGMHVIMAETDRLSSMVEELLDFSRMQSGRMTLVKTIMDPLAELGDAVLMYTERARRDNITLTYDEPESVSLLFGDKNRLRQVFINVIDNALKYSDPGDQVSVKIWEENNAIYVSVADTGCGISAEDLPRIKQKFFKANLTRRGSGIGLAVADEIVQMHDGSITLDSVLGEGTTVTIRLPVNLKKGETRKTEISTSVDTEEGTVKDE